MDKYEILFSIIIIVAYLICSLTLNIPIYIHIIFGIILLAILIIAVLLKVKGKYENEKISKIFRIISIILLVWFGISFGYETLYHKPLLISSGLIIILIFIVEVTGWILRKNENN